MYLYFNRDGVLKEIINDKPSRQGNSLSNKIYVYYEGMVDLNGDFLNTVYICYCRFRLPDNEFYPSLTTTQLAVRTTTKQEIPFNEKQDLKFFKYFKAYNFYVITLQDEIFAESGSVSCSIWFNIENTIFAMGLISFMVEEEVIGIQEDQNINISQWNELLKLFGVSNVKAVPTLPQDGSEALKKIYYGEQPNGKAGLIITLDTKLTYEVYLDLDEDVVRTRRFVFALDASDIEYNNDNSGLESDNVQDAIDELDEELSNTAKLNEENTFTAQQTFEEGIKFNNNAYFSAASSNILSLQGAELFAPSGLRTSYASPYVDNYYDLGSFYYHWKDLYLVGKIKTGTKDINVNNILQQADLTPLQNEIANLYDILYDTIFVSAEEDFSGVNFIIPSTLTLEDTLPHDIVDKLPLTLKSVKGRTWIKNQICSPLNSGNWHTQSTTGTLSEKTENSVLFTRSQTESTTNVTVVYQLQSAYKILAGNQTHLKVDLTPSADCSVRLFGGAYQPHDVKIYANQKNHIEAIITATANGYPLIIIGHADPLPLGGTILIENFKGTDLTKMFGAGNEPTTVDEFNELTRNIDLDTFDEGSVINVNITEIKSYAEYVSVDLGTLSWYLGATGCFETASIKELCKKPTANYVKANIISSKYETKTISIINPIGSTENGIAMNVNGLLACRDTNYTDVNAFKQSLQGVILYYQPNNPLDAPVIDTVDLTVSDLDGIGTAQDTITWDGTNRTKTKVIAKVDLGTLNYSYSGTNEVFTSTTSIPCKPNQNYDYANIKCIKYIPTRTQDWNEGIDKSISINNSGQVVIKDTAYQDPATLKTALSNVYLYFELATPIITTTTETALDIDFQTGGYLTIDSEVWADIIAEFLVKDWSN